MYIIYMIYMYTFILYMLRMYVINIHILTMALFLDELPFTLHVAILLS